MLSVGADAPVRPPHRTPCNTFVGATLAAARLSCTALLAKIPVIARAHRQRDNPSPQKNAEPLQKLQRLGA